MMGGASLLPKVTLPPVVITAMLGEKTLCVTSTVALVATPGCLGASSMYTTPPVAGGALVAEKRTTPATLVTAGGSFAVGGGSAAAGEAGGGVPLQPRLTAATIEAPVAPHHTPCFWTIRLVPSTFVAHNVRRTLRTKTNRDTRL